MNKETVVIVRKANVQILLDRLAKDESFDFYGSQVCIVGYTKTDNYYGTVTHEFLLSDHNIIMIRVPGAF